MFTPADLEEISFERSVVGGYKITEVEDFVNKLSAEYTALYKENEELRKKLKIVVDKVEGYRNKESLISEALLSAQSEKSAAAINAANIVEEAKSQALKMLEESTAEAEAQKKLAHENAEKEIAAVNKEIEAQKKHLAAVKKEVSDFKQRIQELYKDHLTNIMAIPSYEEPEEAPHVTPVAAAEPEPAREPVPEDAEEQLTVSEYEPEPETEAEPEAAAFVAVSEAPAAPEAEPEEDDFFFGGRKEPAEPKYPEKTVTDDTDDFLLGHAPSSNKSKSGLSDVFDFSNDESDDDKGLMSFVVKKKKK